MVIIHEILCFGQPVVIVSFYILVIVSCIVICWVNILNFIGYLLLPKQVWQAIGNYDCSHKNGHNSRTIRFRGKMMVPADSEEQNLSKFVTKKHQMAIVKKWHMFCHTH